MSEVSHPEQPTQEQDVSPPLAEMPLPESVTHVPTEQEEQAISAAIDEAVAAAMPGSEDINVDEAVAASIAATEAPVNELPSAPAAGADDVLQQQSPDPVFLERPLGRICPAGEEYTGRWTREEQERFIEGLERYGKEWKKVAAVVETRTIVQVRMNISLLLL